MDYSIVIPVFNREDLTRNCLATLRPTLAGAGEGEVIVVDNGSGPQTAAVLAEFPWVRVIRNDRNLGFAAACNQGARAATGRYVVHLNNDTKALDGWLARMLAWFAQDDVGIVGARLLFPTGKIQHAGVALGPARFGPEGFSPYHFLWNWPGETPGVMTPADFEVVTGACLVTPRALFLDVGGFDEAYWNGYEDVDFCLKVRERGLRVVYESSAVLYHYESQSGVQRKRRLMHNLRLLGERWSQKVAPDHNRYCARAGYIRREAFITRARTYHALELPPVTVIVHGSPPSDSGAYVVRLNAGSMKPGRILWAAGGTCPPGATAIDDPLLPAVRDEMEVRGDRYLVCVDAASELETEWLAELIDSAEFARDIVAATVATPQAQSPWSPVFVDARCTLIALRTIPQHIRIDTTFANLHGALADLVHRVVERGRSVRVARRPTARLGAPVSDGVFRERYGRDLSEAVLPDPVALEALVTPDAPTFASIVMLSWNAPQYTELAVRSIREHTTTPYEIIIVDNGSGPQTLEILASLTDVRVIYNQQNMGFAHGCNQGISAATGTHVVLLNNDVIVTDGWLESLLDAHRIDGAVGISAPRSNFVAGHQQVHDSQYPDIPAMHEYARERSRRLYRRLYHTDRVIGFCLCISRAVIEEVGGIDTRYPIGNFEDDDFSLRVRAAGYEIVVCDDSFIHHFGNVSFKANNVDYASQLEKNWKIFAERWDLPRAYPANGYDSMRPIARGFNRTNDYVALPVLEPSAPHALQKRAYEIALVAIVSSEEDWSRLAPVIANFARAFTVADPVALAIAVFGQLDAQTIAQRTERAMIKAGVDPERCADVDIADVTDVESWAQGFADAATFAVFADAALPEIDAIRDRSRSGLARLLQTRAIS